MRATGTVIETSPSDLGYRRLAADLVVGAIEDVATRGKDDKRHMIGWLFLTSLLGELCIYALGADPQTVQQKALDHYVTYRALLRAHDADGLAAWRKEYFSSSLYLASVESYWRARWGRRK
jgi:hypothetical protein